MPPFGPTALLVREELIGSILLWQGSLETIPSSWSLCDGSRGTPDLRDQFVPGSCGLYDPGDSGGVASHEHDFDSDVHKHNFGPGVDLLFGVNHGDDTTEDIVSGTTNPTSNLPAYYSLAYIMFLGDS